MLFKLGVFHEDQGPEFAAQKAQQYEVIATAIAEAATAQKGWQGSRLDLAKFLVVMGWHESHWSLRIMRGECKPLECDRGRARGAWQPHRDTLQSKEDWDRIVGLDLRNVLVSAKAAAHTATSSRGLCRSLDKGGDSWVKYAISAYAGRGCSGWISGIDSRLSTWRLLGTVRPES